jgi:transcription elongation factor Elf1
MRVSDILSRIRRRRALAWFRASQILNRAIPLFSRCRDLPGALESRVMPATTKFNCPTCETAYKVVRTDAPPSFDERQLLCLSCGAPLRNREGKNGRQSVGSSKWSEAKIDLRSPQLVASSHATRRICTRDLRCKPCVRFRLNLRLCESRIAP